MLRDYNMEWLRKSIYIPVTSFSGVLASASLGTNADALAAVNSLAVGGLTFSANTSNVAHQMMVPYDLDITKQIDFRIHWTCNQAANMTWVLTYGLYNTVANAELVTSGFDVGTATMAALAAASTALDTVFAASAGSTGFKWLVSGLGNIPKNTLTAQAYGLIVKIGASGTLPTTTTLLGLEMRYSLRKLIGQRRNIHGGRRPTDRLGTQWTNTHQEGF